MVMMELEVVQAIQNLQLSPLTRAVHIIHMMDIIRVWGSTEMMGGILRDEDLICNLAVSLNTLPPHRH